MKVSVEYVGGMTLDEVHQRMVVMRREMNRFYRVLRVVRQGGFWSITYRMGAV